MYSLYSPPVRERNDSLSCAYLGETLHWSQSDKYSALRPGVSYVEQVLGGSFTLFLVYPGFMRENISILKVNQHKKLIQLSIIDSKQRPAANHRSARKMTFSLITAL